MKIGVFSDCYLPTINGVVTSISQQVEILRHLGHEVDLYCPQCEGAPESEEGVYRLWARPFPFHKAEQVALPWPPRVLKRIWTQDYDLFHIQTPFSVGFLGLAAGFSRPLPLIFHHHTLWEEYVDYLPIPKKITSTLSVAVCRGVANRCQGVISPSQQVKERFAGQGVKTPISVIPTGIQTSRFQNGRPLDESVGREVCLYIGRLAHEKSLDALVRVFHRIHSERPSTELWLVGDGPARRDLEQQVQELGLSQVCRFFGFLERDTLRDFVASAKVFLFTSQTETQGLVLLEAQAGGLPVAAFSASGVDEAVESGRTGFLVEEKREDLLAQAALKILSDPSLRKRFAEAAPKWTSNFSVGSMGEALVSTYERALKAAENPEK